MRDKGIHLMTPECCCDPRPQVVPESVDLASGLGGAIVRQRPTFIPRKAQTALVLGDLLGVKQDTDCDRVKPCTMSQVDDSGTVARHQMARKNDEVPLPPSGIHSIERLLD